MSGPRGRQRAERFGLFASLPAPEPRGALCSVQPEIGPGHQHLLELATRKLVCACDACAILFDSQGQAKYRRVPRRVRFLPDFRMTDSHWEGLMMPINMAFFFKSTPQERMVAMYPSPGRRHRIVAFRSMPGRRSRRRIRCCRRWSRTSRRCW